MIEISTDLKQLLTTDQAHYYRIVPKSASSDEMVFYRDDSLSLNGTTKELEIVFGKTIHIEPVSRLELDQALNKFYLKKTEQHKSELSLSSSNFLNELIQEAETLKCSDIHLESYEDKCRIRMRLDGKLVERFIIPKHDYPEFVNKLKIMSNLDIAEKRLPQDGRIMIKEGGKQFDLRVSVLPTLYGEKVVLRLLSDESSALSIEKLGLSGKQKEVYLNSIAKPHGIILISGPTGSGKTTTLYATLKELNDNMRNILTIEDPVEYTLEGINQVQLKEKIGLDYVAALRTFLRQDPDIIMVGEIRDLPTAKMAIRAALTGHLVLSTVHTNSAWGIITRMLEMGISPYILADTINIAIAQRLLRLLCPDCKRRVELAELPFEPLPGVEQHFHEPVGCDQCYGTGYRGRKAIYEMIPVDHQMQKFIKNMDEAPNEEGIQGRIGTLKESAIQLFSNGETSLEEILPYLV